MSKLPAEPSVANDVESIDRPRKRAAFADDQEKDPFLISWQDLYLGQGKCEAKLENELKRCKRKRKVDERRMKRRDDLIKFWKSRCQTLQKKLKELNGRNESEETGKESSEETESGICEKSADILKRYFSANQIEMMANEKQNRRSWTRGDVFRALDLSSVSRNAYIYLKRELNWPLPNFSTLKKFAMERFQVESGILFDVLWVLRMKAKQLKPSEKVCILSFDQMKIDFRYDQSDRDVNSKVLVVMINVIHSRLKQPVFYEVDTRMSKELLLDIIANVQDCGFHVLAVVSKLNEESAQLWRYMNVSPVNSSFTNPNFDPERKIWVFSEVRNLLIQLRNNFLEHGITLPSKRSVSQKFSFTKEVIEELITLDVEECTETHNLTMKHISCAKETRNKFHLARKLFSRNTCVALDFAKDDLRILRFFAATNLLFETFDSRSNSPIDFDSIFDPPKPFKNRADQVKAISDFKRLMLRCRFGKEPFMLPFQKGFVMSINSLMGLYLDFKKFHGGKFLLTADLNLEWLEHVFGQMRGLGEKLKGTTSPSFKERMRMLLVGVQPDFPFPKTSIRTLKLLIAGKIISANLFGGLKLNEEKKEPSEHEEWENSSFFSDNSELNEFFDAMHERFPNFR